MGELVVDLAAIVDNWRRITALAGPTVEVAAAVKADGYGLGASPVAMALKAAGCRWFFVASPAEAEEVKAAVSETAASILRIAVLSGYLDDTRDFFEAAPGLVPVLNDLAQVQRWSERHPGRASVLHLDTGMARLGLPPEEVRRLAEDRALLDRLRPVLAMSHLACADEPERPENARQLGLFREILPTLPPMPASLAASSGTHLGPEYHFQMVRIGAALYGINPTPGRPNPMRPVVRVTAKILQIRDLAAGEPVGYGATHHARTTHRIATIGLGYAQGLMRSAGGRAQLHFGAVPLPVIGRVSMDLVTVDASAVPDESLAIGGFVPGGSVDVIGPHYGIDALARDSGTIGYEILTRLGGGLPRTYLAA